MINQFAHVSIHSNDLEETGRFYLGALGLEKGFEFIKDGALFGYYIKLGNNTFIEVFKGDPGEVGNINHIAIQTDDIDEVIERVRKHGYEIGEKSLGADHSWQVWTADPNGVRIEFHQYTEQSLQLTGGVCQVDW
ncbi:MAG: VOC family protein [Kiritimatiellales bacterium]|nr:VOC family protein [Kiritimatiellota bacterium]MBL7011329.1 VOC family protein [Kiritimatiellales bacterium]